MRRRSRSTSAIISDHLVVHRLRTNQPLTDADLKGLESTLVEIGEEDGETLFSGLLARSESPSLAHFVRSLVGLDRTAAQAAFSGFLADRSLTPPQIRFIEMVINQLSARGVIEASALYEPPFSNLHAEGPDALFAATWRLSRGFSRCSGRSIQDWLLSRSTGAVIHGKEPSKFNQDCTICASCRWKIPGCIVPQQWKTGLIGGVPPPPSPLRRPHRSRLLALALGITNLTLCWFAHDGHRAARAVSPCPPLWVASPLRVSVRSGGGRRTSHDCLSHDGWSLTFFASSPGLACDPTSPTAHPCRQKGE